MTGTRDVSMTWSFLLLVLAVTIRSRRDERIVPNKPPIEALETPGFDASNVAKGCTPRRHREGPIFPMDRSDLSDVVLTAGAETKARWPRAKDRGSRRLLWPSTLVPRIEFAHF